MTGALGRITPPDFDHITAKPLAQVALEQPKPVSIGTPWYTAFDTPRQAPNGSWYLPDCSTEDLGTVRGGHCTCLAPSAGGVAETVSNPAWQVFYNQGQEGACEGFGHAHAITLEKGFTVNPWFLYDEARRLEGTYPSGEGTTNREVAKVLEAKGVPQQTGQVATRGATDGAVERITTVRWTQDTQEVLEALGRLNASAVPLLNSWGTAYPMVVWLPVATLTRLLAEEGEADCITDA